MVARLVTLLVLAVAAAAPAAQAGSLPGPTGLHAFLLRADEPIADTFSRTPSFAWTPYDGATGYDFQLATSKTFDDGTIVWSSAQAASPLRAPAIGGPLALPWMTGHPYALYARVRAHVAGGVTRWSAPFGFNMRWKTVPQQVTPDIPGLVRWTPVEGATSYEVWFLEADKVITTTTNVADEREYYTFRDPSWNGIVTWRVRAVRKLYGTIPNGLPAVSYGPWSDPFVSTNPPPTSGPLSLTETVSDVVDTPTSPQTHALTPGFVFSGDAGIAPPLYRVYVATDRQCVNVVFTSSVVGSPAYAPRTSGALALPTSGTWPRFADGAQSGLLGADAQVLSPSDQTSAAGTPGSTAATAATPSASSTIPSDFASSGPYVDLWDLGQPNGRYWWTVVPVVKDGQTYRDVEVPQDACAAGRVMEFAKASAPATTALAKPYVSGLSGTGELVAAASRTPTVYKAALIAWEPAPGAVGYEVQWSRTLVPWRPAQTAPQYTAATSLLFQGLAPGTWYYRVRGIDPYLPGPVKQMTWSRPVRIVVARPRFLVQTGVSVTHLTK